MRRLGIAERRVDAGAKFRLAAWQGRDAALAGRPIAGRHVEQGLDEPVPFERRRDGLRRMVVGAEIFDRLEAALRGGRETVEKLDLLEDEAQIGGEFRHWTILL